MYIFKIYHLTYYCLYLGSFHYFERCRGHPEGASCIEKQYGTNPIVKRIGVEEKGQGVCGEEIDFGKLGRDEEVEREE